MSKFKNIFEVIAEVRRELSPLIPETFTKSSSFCLISDPNNLFTLAPKGQFLFYFRGESSVNPACKAKIYRNYSYENYILHKIQQVEFELLLKNSPLIDGQGDFSFEIIGRNLVYQVNYLALCQHFGIPTEYLDLTNDLFIALFFATHCGYPPTPVYEGEGTLYIYRDDNCENVKTIGMQLFPRPGEQKAFAIQLDSNDDFSKFSNTKKHIFQHTKEGSDFINELFKGGTLLFPKDIIENKANEIIKGSEFSIESLNIVHERYFKDLDRSVLIKQYAALKKSFTSCLPTFSKEEISVLINYLSIFIDRLNHSTIRRVIYPKDTV